MNVTFSSSVARCADMIQSSVRIVLLSGAGLSTSAGIPDFRGPEGLYRKLGIENPERIFDIGVFERDPSFYYGFHKEFLRQVEAVKPTAAHRFFARLEEQGKLDGIVTQNIDALHQKAGSSKVLEIHGSIWRSHCTRCGKGYSYEASARKVEAEGVPHCDSCRAVLKPDVVFFGENVMQFDACQELVARSDLLFVVGSSLVVTPAAWLPSLCPGKIVVVNKGEISRSYLPSSRVALHVEEDIDTFFTALAEKLGLSV
ncbi:MAG: NAD-dependent deacetylase [Synergistales bacterium]